MADEKILDEVREMGHELGFQRGLEVAARIALERVMVADAIGGFPAVMRLQSPVEIAAAIRGLPGGAGTDARRQDAIYRSYLAKVMGPEAKNDG